MNRLLRLRALPFLVGGGGFALVLLWTFTAAPRYRSSALLQVDAGRSSSALGELVQGLPGLGMLGAGSPDIGTQIGVLRSVRVLDAVMDSLGLDVSVVAPAPGAAPMLNVRTNPAAGAAVEGSFTLRADDGGRWALVDVALQPAADLPSALAEGEPARIGPHELTVVEGLSSRGVRQLNVQISPRYLTRRSVAARLDVRQQNVGSNLVSLTFDDTDPLRAAAVLERVLGEYLRFTQAAARGDAGTTVAELRRQVAEQGERLAAAENALRAYQERTGIFLPGEQGAAQVTRYAKLRASLDQLEVERNALARLIALVESRASREPGSAAYRQLGTFPSLIANRAIQDLLTALLSLENERSELQLLRSADNPDVRRITQRIGEIESELQRIGAQYLESLDQQIVPTRAAMQAIDDEMAAMPERELRFLRLLRDRTLLNEGYLALQQQLRVTEVEDALRLDAVRIVDAPLTPHPDDPYFPRVPVHIAIAIIFALASGGAVAVAQGALTARE